MTVLVSAIVSSSCQLCRVEVCVSSVASAVMVRLVAYMQLDFASELMFFATLVYIGSPVRWAEAWIRHGSAVIPRPAVV